MAKRILMVFVFNICCSRFWFLYLTKSQWQAVYNKSYKGAMKQVFLFIIFLMSAQVSLAQQSVMDFYEESVPTPQVVWKDLYGNDISMAQFEGKVVLLNLWATWCKPCQIEMPAFNFLQKRYKAGGFEVVAIAIQDQPVNVAEFIKQKRLTEITPFIDVDESVGRIFQPKSMPTTFLINRKGKIIAGKSGISDWLSTEMMTLIENELKKDQPTFKLPENLQVIDRNDIHGGIRF
jgi:thiol-disulfide isomerase/thioredoxin